MPKKCIPVLLLAASLFAPLAGASTAPAPKTVLANAVPPLPLAASRIESELTH